MRFAKNALLWNKFQLIAHKSFFTPLLTTFVFTDESPRKTSFATFGKKQRTKKHHFSLHLSERLKLINWMCELKQKVFHFFATLNLKSHFSRFLLFPHFLAIMKNRQRGKTSRRIAFCLSNQNCNRQTLLVSDVPDN